MKIWIHSKTILTELPLGFSKYYIKISPNQYRKEVGLYKGISEIFESEDYSFKGWAKAKSEYIDKF